MARGTRGHRASTGKRDASAIARLGPSVDPLLSYVVGEAHSLPDFVSPPAVRSIPLSEIEDRRFFDPQPDRFPRGVRRWKAALASYLSRPAVHPTRGRAVFLPAEQFFKVPETVALCARRKSRREVLHALKRAGRGVAKPRRTWRSELKCR